MPTDDWSYNGTPWYKSRTVLGIMALGTAESVFLFVQFAEIIKSKNADGVSIVAFTIYLLATVGWLIWASLSHDAALLVTSAITLVGAMMVLAAIYQYGGETVQPREVDIVRKRPDLVAAETTTLPSTTTRRVRGNASDLKKN